MGESIKNTDLDRQQQDNLHTDLDRQQQDNLNAYSGGQRKADWQTTIGAMQPDVTPVIDPTQYSPLVLAYLGDAVYTLIVRSRQVFRENKQVDKLNREHIQYVQAAGQAELMRKIEGSLTAEEHAVYKRGRNTSSHSTPKNQSVGDYRIATGFEALLGWLYLRGETGRITELLELAENAE